LKLRIEVPISEYDNIIIASKTWFTLQFFYILYSIFLNFF
jgi:hypothetical protein